MDRIRLGRLPRTALPAVANVVHGAPRPVTLPAGRPHGCAPAGPA